MRSRISGESICAVWPVVRLEKRSTSLSKRSRICWGVDLFIGNQRSLFQFRIRRCREGKGKLPDFPVLMRRCQEGKGKLRFPFPARHPPHLLPLIAGRKGREEEGKGVRGLARCGDRWPSGARHTQPNQAVQVAGA